MKIPTLFFAGRGKETIHDQKRSAAPVRAAYALSGSPDCVEELADFEFQPVAVAGQ
jgi:hypothetical protein